MHRFTLLKDAKGNPNSHRAGDDTVIVGWACSRCGMVRWATVGDDLPQAEPCAPNIKYIVDVEMDGEQFWSGDDDDGEREGLPVEKVDVEAPARPALRKVG